jgi:outer membrane lipoprotein-sorting protein
MRRSIQLGATRGRKHEIFPKIASIVSWFRGPVIIAGALMAASCGRGLMKLPAGPGAPAPDAAAALAEATGACRSVTSMTAVAAVRGSVGRQRLRGNLETGVAAPASARLEAIAPFGQPIFIFVARGDEATLLLPRDRRVLEGGRPDAVLEAVTGVPLDPADLRLTLTGCARTVQAAGRAVGDEWRVIPDGAGELYLRRERDGDPWRLIAAVRRDDDSVPWRAEYRDFQNNLPRSVRLTSLDGTRFDLRLTLSQVEINTPLEAAVFQLEVPASADPITIEELRQSGPLADGEPPAPR